MRVRAKRYACRGMLRERKAGRHVRQYATAAGQAHQSLPEGHAVASRRKRQMGAQSRML